MRNWIELCKSIDSIEKMVNARLGYDYFREIGGESIYMLEYAFYKKNIAPIIFCVYFSNICIYFLSCFNLTCLENVFINGAFNVAA